MLIISITELQQSTQRGPFSGILLCFAANMPATVLYTAIMNVSVLIHL